MQYMVVVVCAEQRFVEADGPIDAIQKAISPSRETTDEQWEWDYKVERVHVWIDDTERRILLPKKTLAEINKHIKQAYEEPQVWHELDHEEMPSWSQIRAEDIKSVKGISLKQVLRKNS